MPSTTTNQAPAPEAPAALSLPAAGAAAWTGAKSTLRDAVARDPLDALAVSVFGGSYLLLMLTDRISPLRVTADEERVGLDLSQHGERMSALEDRVGEYLNKRKGRNGAALHPVQEQPYEVFES